MREQESISLFDTLYAARGMASQRRYPNERLIGFIASRLAGRGKSERDGLKVLEVGCGSGANLWYLAKEGLAAYGMDASPTGLALARENLRDNWSVEADLALGKFTQLPYLDDQFDFVVDVVSLQHLDLESSKRAFAEVARVLKPKGEFFSYRLGDHSSMFRQHRGEYIDAATVFNITDPSMPLHDNGPISFWSPALARHQYALTGLAIDAIDIDTRTYSSGHMAEYLSITASLC